MMILQSSWDNEHQGFYVGCLYFDSIPSLLLVKMAIAVGQGQPKWHLKSSKFPSNTV